MSGNKEHPEAGIAGVPPAIPVYRPSNGILANQASLIFDYPEVAETLRDSESRPPTVCSIEEVDMWTKLIDIVEKRWNETVSPRKQSLAKAINTLYGSMHNCHIAFQSFESDPSEANFANFAFAIDGMISTIKNLNPILNIFDKELADRLTDYVQSKDRIADMSHPRDLVKSQIRLLRELINMESSVVRLPEEEFSAFTGAKERLCRFIAANLSTAEIFGEP
jgi:hypothetical protein